MQNNEVQVMPDKSSLKASISKMTEYMRFVGMFYIVYGAVTCIGIITAVIGVPMIMAGKRLREAAESFNKYSDSESFQDILSAVESQKRAFFIIYVFAIIAIILIALYIIAIVGFLVYQ